MLEQLGNLADKAFGFEDGHGFVINYLPASVGTSGFAFTTLLDFRLESERLSPPKGWTFVSGGRLPPGAAVGAATGSMPDHFTDELVTDPTVFVIITEKLAGLLREYIR